MRSWIRKRADGLVVVGCRRINRLIADLVLNSHQFTKRVFAQDVVRGLIVKEVAEWFVGTEKFGNAFSGAILTTFRNLGRQRRDPTIDRASKDTGVQAIGQYRQFLIVQRSSERELQSILQLCFAFGRQVKQQVLVSPCQLDCVGHIFGVIRVQLAKRKIRSAFGKNGPRRFILMQQDSG